MSELDIGAFESLMEESQDLHTDAMRGMKDPMDELVDLGRERRASAEYIEARREEESLREEAARRGISPIAAALGVFGTVGLVAASSSSAFAAEDVDVQALQTAASLENLAVATYKKALTLPYLKGNARPIKTVRAFAMITMGQHAEHSQAFNARVKELGGKPQKKTNPKYTPIVNEMVPKLKKGGPLDVVELAITLEDVATSTYVANETQINDHVSRLLFGTVAGVESQHLATLYAVRALLKAGKEELITVKATGGATNAAKLPAAAGSVGSPEGFKKTENASPVEEGAVR